MKKSGVKTDVDRLSKNIAEYGKKMKKRETR